MFSGGILQELTCNHPNLGRFSFDPSGSEDCTVDEGGIVSNDDDTMSSASGAFVDSMTMQRDTLSCTIMSSPGDGKYEALRSLSQSTVLGSWTATNINGTVYKITGKPVGRFTNSQLNSTVEVKLAGNAGSLQII